MKKALSLISALILCLSLCACDSKSSKQSKYDALIECIDNDDYAGAMTELHKLLGMDNYTGSIVINPSYSQDATTEPTVSYTEMEITTENWQEYFEITIEEHWGENAFGEPDYISRNLIFRVKDTYADKVAPWDFAEPQDISIEIGYDYTNYKWTIDFENQTYEKGSISDYDPEGYETIIKKLDPYSLSIDIDRCTRWKDGTGSVAICEYTNIEVLRIKGTLFLKNS